jgi:hypothetical protein
VTAVAENAGNAVSDNATRREAGEFPQWLKKPVADYADDAGISR